jgi:hypothetical protein
MRVRRTIIAPVILTISALGSRAAGPAVAALSAPAAAAASSSSAPNAYIYHA